MPFRSSEDLDVRQERQPEPPLVVVLGGAMVAEATGFIQTLLGRAQTILLGGNLGYTFLKAQGIAIGKSPCEDNQLPLALALLWEAKAQGTKLLLPVDHVVAAEPSPSARCGITDDPSIPENKMGLDIGPETVAIYLEELQHARTILWRGAMGSFELEPFAAGTLTMAEELAALADQGALVLLSGGDCIAAADRAGVASRISQTSTHVNVGFERLSGLTLPGLANLQSHP